MLLTHGPIPRFRTSLARALLALAAGALPAWSVAAETWTLSGRIVHVHDGDSITLLDAQNRQHKIRLDGIDAPELGQAFGQASRRQLQEASLRREAEARCHKTDRYDREVCQVTVDGADISLQQLEHGMAWMFRRYARELSATTRRSYDSAETFARERQRGLWSEASPQPPWEWRAARATKPETVP